MFVTLLTRMRRKNLLTCKLECSLNIQILLIFMKELFRIVKGKWLILRRLDSGFFFFFGGGGCII